MVECIPHPDDPALWLPVEEAIATLWRERIAMRALLEGYDNHAKAQDSALSALAGRVGEQDAIIGALSERLTATEGALRLQVKALEDKVTEQGVWLAELDARVHTLEDPSALGVDVSGHQTVAQVQAAASDPANGFVIVKATEGQGSRNADYAAQRAASGAKFVGAYHFAWPNQDPLKEAANFLTVAALKRGEVAFLDVENWGTGSHPTPEMQATPWSQRLTFTLAWLDEVKAKTGGTPVLYANWDWVKNLRTTATAAQWARLTAYPLWLADYSGTPGQHSTVNSKDGTDPDSWPIVVHQYGVVGGLDRNYTPDLPALRALAVK